MEKKKYPLYVTPNEYRMEQIISKLRNDLENIYVIALKAYISTCPIQDECNIKKMEGSCFGECGLLKSYRDKFKELLRSKMI